MCLIGLFAPTGGYAERLLMLTWDVDAGKGADQVESVLWSLTERVGTWVPAGFHPVESPQAAAEAEAEVERAWAFLRADADGRRTPESLNEASGAFLRVKDALGSVSPPLVGKAALTLAIPTLRNGQEALAREYAGLALRTWPDAALSSKRFGEDAERLMAAAQSELELNRPESHRVEVEPGDATVRLNGDALGAPTRELSGKPGLHLLQISAPGYFPRGWIVEIGGRLRGQKLALRSHPSRSRWERELAALRKAPRDDRGLTAASGVADLVRLAEADALLAIAVRTSPERWILEGGVWAAGAWRPVRAEVPRTVEALAGFEAFLRGALPTQRREAPPPPAH